MANTALITGASTGIGADLARLHAQKGGDLVLVARRQEKLEALKNELEAANNINVTLFVQDMEKMDAAKAIFEFTESNGIQVDKLINNAGFGGHGFFHERPLDREEAMIQLNITALTSLTHYYLPGMIKRGNGSVLNVASTAGFLPGPLQAVYYATKAYVLSFSQAIAQELGNTGVTVTALCPGPVETEFARAADLDGVAAFKGAASSMSVAQCGYNAMEKGKLVAINDPKLSLSLNWIVPLLPRKMMLKISRMSMEKSG